MCRAAAHADRRKRRKLKKMNPVHRSMGLPCASDMWEKLVECERSIGEN